MTKWYFNNKIMYVNLRHKESHGSSCLIFHHAWKATLDESGREIFCWLRKCETAWRLAFVTSKKVHSNQWKILVWHKKSQSISIYNKNLVEKKNLFLNLQKLSAEIFFKTMKKFSWSSNIFWIRPSLTILGPLKILINSTNYFWTIEPSQPTKYFSATFAQYGCPYLC